MCWFNLGSLRSLPRDVLVQDAASGLEREGQSWEQLLWTTGGKLELSKCLLCILFCIFESDGTCVSNALGDDLVALSASAGKNRLPAKSKTVTPAPKPTGLLACGRLPIDRAQPNLKKVSPTMTDFPLTSTKLLQNFRCALEELGVIPSVTFGPGSTSS